MTNIELYSNSFSHAAIKHLSSLTGHSEERLYQMTINYYEDEFPGIREWIVKKRTIKSCPMCIKENGRHQQIWGLTSIN